MDSPDREGPCPTLPYATGSAEKKTSQSAFVGREIFWGYAYHHHFLFSEWSVQLEESRQPPFHFLFVLSTTEKFVYEMRAKEDLKDLQRVLVVVQESILVSRFDHVDQHRRQLRVHSEQSLPDKKWVKWAIAAQK